MSWGHVSAAALHINADAVTFASLPPTLACRVFLALPLEDRGRASCVCRAWRDVLADPSLWSRLVVRAEERERFLAVLHGATARARGGLRQLDVSQHFVLWDELLPVLTANAGSLRELHLQCVDGPDADTLDVSLTTSAVMTAAPLLQVLKGDEVTCWCEQAVWLLRAQPPAAALQMRHSLHVFLEDQVNGIGRVDHFGAFTAALADASLQPALSHVCVEFADVAQPAVMSALADAVVARRLRELRLDCCSAPAAAPLARLLAEGSLTHFEVGPLASSETELDVAGAALVADALRVNTTLTKLELCGAHLFGDMLAAQLFLGALVGHRSLREVRIVRLYIDYDDTIVFGAALAALIAADAPSLQVLACSEDHLGDAGLTPIVEALALNRHLRTLHLDWNGMSERFARERLLPAVRANTSLRWFTCLNQSWGPPAAEDAEEVVFCRGQRGSYRKWNLREKELEQARQRQSSGF